jgi:hypothetical protein
MASGRWKMAATQEQPMTTLRSLTFLCAFLGACVLGVAQDKDAKDPKPPKDDKKAEKKKEPDVKVGDKMPVLKVDTIGNSKMKSLAEVRGRLVLYEYFQHW